MLTVAIVGRPNTGKSTLFNRLVGKRVAITLKEPGTTRDRIIQPAEWLGRRFWVIDTGGLVPDATEVIEKEIAIQVELAISESDIVLLLVDAREGLNPVDRDIARRLNRNRKRFLLVVNKVDNPRVEHDTAEFYQLGVKELFPICAEHGTGVDELLDRIFELFPEPAANEAGDQIRLVILGRPNVGKSSFLNALLGTYRSIVHELPGTTRDSVEATFELEGRKFLIVDTAGIRRRSRVDQAVEYLSVLRAVRNIDDADIAILMLDVRAGVTAQDKRIATLVAEKGKGLVIAANKADLLTGDAVQSVRDWLRSTLPYISHVPIVFTSALMNRDIQQVIHEAVTVFDRGGQRIGKREIQEQLLPRLQASPPRRGATVRDIIQTRIRPPEFKLRVSDFRVIDNAYLRFVEHEIRRCFGFPGYPIRIRAGR
jgi:GTP-binding protein